MYPSYYESVIEIFDKETQEQMRTILNSLVPQAPPHFFDMFPPFDVHGDAFGTDLVVGDVVAYSGKLYDDTLTINKGTVEEFKGDRVLVYRQCRSTRYGVDAAPRRVWVAARKVVSVNSCRQPED
ncbi:hypothetical protein GCM10010149_88220 [Nonomuraea roseoviolacea subsp. roseoviolacea]|uniref:hypothetical protein n=1 Tax=Nonomuraea roseoviolacea TaxID=103837 RepID=UPI0031E175D4